MREFIPDFIIEKYSKNNYQGEFQAFTLTMDLAGFTSLTDYLMKKDREGVEILNGMLTEIFGTIIEIVHQNNGFISSFAGDSMTAIFPDISKPSSTLTAAKKIKKFIKRKSVVQTKYGELNINLTMGISSGNISWGIIGPDYKKIFLFKGNGLDKCYIAEDLAEKNQIVIDKEFHQICADFVETEKINRNFYVLSNINLKEVEPSKILEPSYPKDNSKVFFPENLPDFNYVGEFRNTASVFIRFEDIYKFEKLDELVTDIIRIALDYGGFFNKILFYPNGGEILVLFGAPISYPHNPERACNFSLQLIQKYPFSIGISYGLAYTGIIGNKTRCEYTGLGNVVNLAHRINDLSVPGEILISEHLHNLVKDKFITDHRTTTAIKGFKQDQAVYRILSVQEKTTIHSGFKGKFLGRSAQLNKMIQLSRPIFENKSGRIISLLGKTGIGKSRLVHEFVRKLDQQFNLFIFQSDEILGQSMNPVIYFLKSYFQLNTVAGKSEKKLKFELVFNKFSEQIEKLQVSPSDLWRIKSVICSMLGIKLENSLLDNIESKQKIELINQTLKDFIILLCAEQPIILLFEDIQWLDDDSKYFIRNLIKNIEKHPLLVIFTSRLNDDDSLPELITDEKFSHVLTLDKLEKKSEEKLIFKILQFKPDQSVVNFISEKSGGNPLFIEQYCYYLKETDNIEIKNNQAYLKKDIDNIPSTINDLLITRIDRLSLELKETSQIASILGREFNLNLLYELIKLYQLNINSTSLVLSEQNFYQILSLGVMENLWDKVTDINYIFNHVLLHEVIYSLQLKSRLRKLHNYTGEIMEKLYGEQPDHFPEIAYHFEKAEQNKKAYLYYYKSSLDLKDNYFNLKALEYANKCLKLSMEVFGDSSEQTHQVYFLIGSIYKNLSNYRKSIDYLHRAINFFNQQPEQYKDILTDLYLDLGVAYRYLGNYDESMSIYEKLISYCGDNLEEKADVYDNIGVVYHEIGKYQKSIEYSQKALNSFIKTIGINNQKVADASNNLGVVYLDMGEYQLAFDSYNRALEIMKKIKQEKNPKTAHIYNNISAYYYYIGQYQKSIEYSKKGLKILMEIFGENHADVAYLYNNLGAIYNELHDFERSIPYIQKALNIYQNIFNPHHSYASAAYSNLGYAFMEIKQYEKCSYYFYKSLKIKIEIYGKEHVEALIIYYNIAKLKIDLSEYNQALALLKWIYKKLIRFYGDKNIYSYLALYRISLVYYYKDEILKAERCLKKSYDFFKRDSSLNQSFAVASELYGDILSKKHQKLKAVKYYKDALKIYREKKISYLIDKLQKKIKVII
ncbi:MAG: tetratricopeptide repeat protein [bacterium]